MAKQPVGVWGIDLGQCGLKAIRLIENEGVVTATAFDFVEHPKILSQPDADPDQLTREALEKFLSRNQIRGDVVCISVPGQSGLARFVKLPPVEEKKIGDIVRFEAKQQIPFNLDEVVWDYQKLGSGLVTDGFAMETEIGLFAMKRDMVNRYLQHFKDVNVDVHIVQMAPLALCNFVAYDLLKKGPEPEEASAGKKTAVVALDIGTDSSNLVVTDGGRIIWQRPIPLGGNHFTRALTKDMKLTFAKAEHLKRNAIKSPDLKKILASIKPVLNDFVGEVQRSLGYFTNTHRDVQIDYMVGLGNAFRLPGLQRYLAEKLSLDVRKLEKMDQLSGDAVVGSPAFNENILSFAVAYGLAVQGLKKSKLLTNLLPQEIRTERLIKGKKPWAAAAAAALLLAVGGVALSYGLEWAAFGGAPVTTAREKGKKILGKISAAESAFVAAQKAAKDEEDAIGSIVSGQKEQRNWIELFKFIDKVVPRPEDAKEKEFQDFLLGPPAKTAEEASAYKTHTQWLQDGVEVCEPWLTWRAGKSTRGKQTVSADELGPNIDRLIQFNIEAVSCRYSTNLKTYWDKVLKDVSDHQNFIRPKSDITTIPATTDKGWIVELRGYTFHKGRTQFIVDALLDRIAREGGKKEFGWPLGEDKVKLTPPPVPGRSQGVPNTAGSTNKKKRAISHVVLYATSNQPTNDAGNFETIGSSKLSSVLGGTTGKPGQKDGMPPAMGKGGQRTGGPERPNQPGKTGSTTAWNALSPESVSGASATTAKGDKKPRHNRTEFVIFFIWHEPAPSNALLKQKAAAATSQTQGGMDGRYGGGRQQQYGGGR